MGEPVEVWTDDPGSKENMAAWCKNAASIPELLEIAHELGIKLYACNTTLAVMDVRKEDLIQGVEFAGAPAFLDFAGESDIQLFA